MSRDCAPVALFVYNRLDHARRTIEALQKNPLAASTDLIVFSDAAKRPEAEDSVWQVRGYVHTVDGFRAVKVVERPHNFGLARSITEGVAAVCADYGRVIVLEDDLDTSPFFLTFMNDALDFYADNPRIAAVSGYHLPSDIALPQTFFQRDAECWGWATWRRAWLFYNPDGAALLAELSKRGLLSMFDQEGSYPYVRMLRDQIAGRNGSWAVRWRASVILNDMLSLYPGVSLTRNMGFDGTGTHCVTSDAFGDELAGAPVPVHGIPLVHSEDAYQAFVRFNRSQIPSLGQRVSRKVKKLFRSR